MYALPLFLGVLIDMKLFLKYNAANVIIAMFVEDIMI